MADHADETVPIDYVGIDEKVITITETPLPGSGVLTTLGGEPVEVRVNDGIPTQIANPSRASWRTFVQSAVSFLILANIALPIVQGWLEANVDGAQVVLGPAYPWIVVGVNAAVLAFSLGAKLVALIMANPRLNEWITKHLSFLAPIPQRKVIELPLAQIDGGEQTSP